MNLQNALKIHGWMSDTELYWLASQAATHTNILEIGSWKGRSTRALSDNTSGKVTAVDTWNGTPEDGHFQELKGKPEDWLYNEFLKNKGKNVQAYRGDSSTWVKKFGITMKKVSGDEFIPAVFDMIFIDGDHSYEAVSKDIQACLPLLAKGGLLCGHDFDAGRVGVVRAVKEFVPNYAKLVDGDGENIGSIWIMENNA